MVSPRSNEVDVQLSLQDRMVSLLGEHIEVTPRIGYLADRNLIAVRVGEIVRVVCANPADLQSCGTRGCLAIPLGT